MTTGINLAALGFGGIDTSSLVSGLVAIQEQPYNQLSAKVQNNQAAQATVSSFASDLSALKSAALALSDPTTFTSMTASSNDPSIAATVSGGSTGSSAAAPGQWDVSVSQVAQGQRSISNGTSDNTSALGLSGDLQISVGTGTPATITVSPTDTLADIADEVSSSGLRVQASMVYDGSQYHLLVAGLDSGAANSITFDESGLSGSGFSLGLSGANSTLQPAQDAHLTVGGIPITSPSNQVSQSIPGVTLAVTRATTSAATVSVASDPSSIQKNLQTFVSAYNAVVNDGHTDAGFGTQAASNPLLQGDQGIRSSLDELSSLVAAAVPGASADAPTLASVGLALNDDGTLTLDTARLSSALSTDPASVERLFVTDATNGSTGIMSTIGSTVDSLANSGGRIAVELQGYTDENARITTEMIAMQQRNTQYQTQLQNEFTQMNTALAQYKQMASALGSTSSSGSGLV